ncbi:MAG: uracil-DNA glycosylase [Bacteroidales bacterium]|jgi:uracil-DNA glycosylase|nr:uracil-DNA glycosylase [Bacteroidales bacterium]MDD4829335.1 uracil-DNA glycosylase [Bacteroidales bacterium]
MDVNIEREWKEVLKEEFEKEYFLKLTEFVRSEYKTQTVYPKAGNIFNAFNLCPFTDVKVVIIGQDPYHEPNQAHGLCFSVLDPVACPPSLQNIYKEIKLDLGIDSPKSGDLTRWAKQGVLLLNATLTVQAHKAGSHQNKGWEKFTDSVIHHLANERQGLVFLLWGSYAQKKGEYIDQTKHLVLKSVHPSPLSAHRGFFGNHHFSQTNTFLSKQGEQPINW